MKADPTGILCWLRYCWGHLYSDEQEVVTYISRMLPILGISFFIDGLHSSLSGW
jgi:MATE family multidrug resistance protein